MEHIAMLGT